jgi:hypothetical protein
MIELILACYPLTLPPAIDGERVYVEQQIEQQIVNPTDSFIHILGQNQVLSPTSQNSNPVILECHRPSEPTKNSQEEDSQEI